MNGTVTMSGERSNDYVVPTPRVTDGIGRTLRAVFDTRSLPSDMDRLLRRLDRLR